MSARACLFLIDLQQDFLLRPGLYPPAPILVNNIVELLTRCRDMSLPVVHVHTVVRTDGSNRMPHWKRSNHWACVEGTDGAMPPPQLQPCPSEPVFIKPFFSAFSNAQLGCWLHDLGIDTLILTGIYTHACIRATIIDAYQSNYQVWVATDGIASNDPLHANLTRSYLENRACHFLAISEILSRLKWNKNYATMIIPDEILPSIYTNGRWKKSQSNVTWIQHNPANWNEQLTTLSVGIECDVENAASLAAVSQTKWRRLHLEGRVQYVSNWADALIKRRERLIELIALEVGKPITDAKDEFCYAADLLQAALRRARCQPSVMRIDSITRDVIVRRCPLGVVGLITPWNNPLAIAIGKIAPALIYGNTVLWKPALPSPGLVMLLTETLAEADIPENCVNIVLGDVSTAQAVISHPRIAAISFTGSEAAGQQVSVLCAVHQKRFQAELGGNNGAIVTINCDIDAIAAELARQAYCFAGQRCTAPRRLIVEHCAYDEFVKSFIKHASLLQIGFPLDPKTQLGPLVSRRRQAYIAALVDQCKREGGRILHGGNIPVDFVQGCWYEPTIVTGVRPDAYIVQEESFGPVVVIQEAKDFDDALRLCNGVKQGLVATLYSDDRKKQRHFLLEAEAGILRINAGQSTIHPDAAFGGWKSSGIGLPEHGQWDCEFYTCPQSMYGRIATSLDLNKL